MSDPIIRKIIEALPLRDGADVDGLSAMLEEQIRGVKYVQNKLALMPNAKTVSRQSQKVVTAVMRLNSALEDLDPMTRDFIWTGIRAEVDDLNRYVTPDEIKALLAPLQQSAQRVVDHKSPDGNRSHFSIEILTNVLIDLFEKSTGRTASDNRSSVLLFVANAFSEAGLKADPEYYLNNCLRHPGA